MAKIDHNDTYVLLRIFQIICAVIATGQAVCIYVAASSSNRSLPAPKQAPMLSVFTLVLGASSILSPFFWLLFQKMSERFPKLVWVELGIDFQFGIAWFLMCMLLMQIPTGDANSGDESSKSAGIERLWMICLIFMLINGTAWSASGIMNTRHLWIEHKRPTTEDTRVLLDEHEFTNRSLRSKPSRSSTTQSSPINYNDMPVEPGPSVVHWQPVTPPYDVEARSSPTGRSMHGRAL